CQGCPPNRPACRSVDRRGEQDRLPEVGHVQVSTELLPQGVVGGLHLADRGGVGDAVTASHGVLPPGEVAPISQRGGDLSAQQGVSVGARVHVEKGRHKRLVGNEQLVGEQHPVREHYLV